MIKYKIVLFIGLFAALCFVTGVYVGINTAIPAGSMVEKKMNTDEASLFFVGESSALNGIEITINSVQVQVAKQYSNRDILLVDVTLENIGDHVQEVSLFKMTLMDDQGYAYEHNSKVKTTGVLSGQLHPNRGKRGEVAFVVPDSEYYDFIYTDHLRTGQAIWRIKEFDIGEASDET